MDFNQLRNMTIPAKPLEQRRLFRIGGEESDRRALQATCAELNLSLVSYPALSDLPTPAEQAVRGCVFYHNIPGHADCLADLHILATDYHSYPVILVLEPGNMGLAVKAMRLGVANALETPLESNQIRCVLTTAWKEEEARFQEYRVASELKQRVAHLTPDEMEVLRRILEGKPNKVIRKELDIGLRTTELRRSKIMKKMKASSLAELVQISVYAGIAPEPKIARDSVVPPEQLQSN